MDVVVVGVDPHKLSVTIEVMGSAERVFGGGRFETTTAGFRQLRRYVAQWPVREWAVEGAGGVGRSLAQRLLAVEETVLDVPAKTAAQVRLLETGHGRKNDAADAHSVALVGLRARRRLRRLSLDPGQEVLRLLSDRRDELVRYRVQTLNRLHRLLAELLPGRVKKKMTAAKAKTLLASVRPTDPVGVTLKKVAAAELADLVSVDKKITAITAELTVAVKDTGTSLMSIFGVGPIGAARILADVGDVARFATADRFATWTGTAPREASSGEQVRHRLSRGGNRRLNHVLHIAAVTQIRSKNSAGRAYYLRKKTEGKTDLEAIRCLKRRLSNVVYRTLRSDADQVGVDAVELDVQAGPGGHSGASINSSAADPTPHVDPSEKPQPGPVTPTLPVSNRRPTGAASRDRREPAPTRRRRQCAAPHRTNDIDAAQASAHPPTSREAAS